MVINLSLEALPDDLHDALIRYHYAQSSFDYNQVLAAAETLRSQSLELSGFKLWEIIRLSRLALLPGDLN